MREAIIFLKNPYRSLRIIMEIATGTLCISTSIVLSMLGRLNIFVMRSAIIGKIIILSKLNVRAFVIFVYLLPYRKTPSIKIAMIVVVLPSICKEFDKGAGISIPIKAIRIPDRMDSISGFVESFFNTWFSPFQIVVFPSL